MGGDALGLRGAFRDTASPQYGGRGWLWDVLSDLVSLIVPAEGSWVRSWALLLRELT